MSLEHVYRWSDHRWKYITLKEAADQFPYTVNAWSGMFYCGLCGQEVTLTGPSKKVQRHFRHRPGNEEDYCEDRSKALGLSQGMSMKDTRGLPLRIKFRESGGFELELGFILTPNISLETLEGCKVKISPIDRNYLLSEHLQEGTITYLSVGSVPEQTYHVSITPQKKELAKLWPESVDGVSKQGTLFDSSTGKKLPFGAYVKAEHKYYLLTQQEPEGCSDVSFYCKCNVSGWRVYTLSFSFTKEAAKYLLKHYNCLLSENEAAMIPLWPVCIETPYLLKYDEAYNAPLWFFLQGDAAIKTYPYAHKDIDGRLYAISCSERQQLLAAGRMKILRYMYLWKDDAALAKETDFPEVQVTDSEKNSLTVTPPYDGYALVMDGAEVVERYTLSAGSKTVIQGVKYGSVVEVYQGLDLVRRIEFKRPVREDVGRDEQLRKALETAGGESISVPHTLGGLAVKMRNYPRVKRWLAKCVRRGVMSEKAYKILAHHFSGGGL